MYKDGQACGLYYRENIFFFRPPENMYSKIKAVLWMIRYFMLKNLKNFAKNGPDPDMNSEPFRGPNPDPE
jgi:hypothetical protein